VESSFKKAIPPPTIRESSDKLEDYHTRGTSVLSLK
jgi:hypothetical protein